MSKLISIVIPAYNCQRFIAETLGNVMAQDYPNKEVIVVNDGSTDGTLDVLDSFGDRIRLIDQPNGGAPAARNTGLQAAHGDYLCLMDADDLWLPGKLTAQARHLDAHPEVGLVYHGWQEWKPGAEGTFTVPDTPPADPGDDRIIPERSGWIYTRLLMECIVHTSTVMFRRSVLEQVGLFDTSLPNGDDYDYWLRMSRVTRMDKLAATYSLYRILPGSIARTPHSVNHEYVVLQNALDRWGRRGPDGAVLSADALRARKAGILFNFGYSHYFHGEPTLAAEAFRNCLKNDPYRLGAWKYLLLGMLKRNAAR